MSGETRPDSYGQLAMLLPKGASLLDLACGDGTFLREALSRGAKRACGVEISEEGVRQCVQAGLSVHHGDITEGLTDYPDASFDCVSLIRTIDLLAEPEPVLDEMLRVGRSILLSFTNHGRLAERLRLLVFGAVPGPAPGRLGGPPARLSLPLLRRFFKRRGIRIDRLMPLGGGPLARLCPGLFAREIAMLLSRTRPPLEKPDRMRRAGAGDGGIGLMP